MKKSLYLFSMMLSFAALTSCSSDDEPQVISPVEEEEPSNGEETPPNEEEENQEEEKTRTISLTDAQKSAVERNNDFAFNLYRTILQSEEFKGKSNVVSPLSLTFALGMLNAGATGQTQSEIVKLLGFDGSDSQAVNDLCSLLIQGAPTVDDAVVLKLANLVATDKTVQLEPQFQQDVADYYDGEAASFDFSSHEAVDYVNDWCKEKTEGLIPSLIDRLDGMIGVFLNAVYFKASWTVPFDPEETAEGEFTTPDGSKQMLQMMHRDSALFYLNGELYKTLGLNYGGGENWMMYVLLPNEGHSVEEVVGSLNSQSWSQQTELIPFFVEYPLSSLEVDVLLPRFKTQSSLHLEKTIADMGAPSMFLPRQELTGISSNYKDLLVNMILQKACIEVSEEGTEGAAATVGGWAGADGEYKHYVPEFHATRPFVYLIQEISSGAIFFIGTYLGE